MTETGVVGVALAVGDHVAAFENFRYAWGLSFNWFTHMFFQKSILNRIENVALKGALVNPILVFRASFFTNEESISRTRPFGSVSAYA